jgi:hypothetical protein
MFSSFLKKLLFAREFSIIDGKVNILGQRFVMLPSELLFRIVDSPDTDAIQEKSLLLMKHIISKVGNNPQGLIDNLPDIFGMFGLGKLTIKSIDLKSKTCILDIDCISSEKRIADVTSAIAEGLVSGCFEKKMRCAVKVSGNKIDITMR